MKDVGIVTGNAEMAIPVYIGRNLIYIHTDIKRAENEENPDLYQYHEYQYTKEEYMDNVLRKMINDISGNEDAVCELSEAMDDSIVELEQAICDLSEEIGGK